MFWRLFSSWKLTGLQQGNRHFVAKNYSAAIDCLLKHAQKHPADAPDAYVRVAECYRRCNTLAKPKPVAPGIALVSAGDVASAEYYYRLAIGLNADHLAALNGLAAVLPEDSDVRCELLERSARRQPSVLVLTALGDFYWQQRKDPKRAYEVYRQRQAHAPKDKTAYERLQELCAELGRAEEAEQWGIRWREVEASKRRVDGR